MPATEKPYFRTEFDRWVREHDSKHRSASDLGETERSKRMVEFYVRHVLGHLNPRLVPETDEDFERADTDGANDLGADFLFRSDYGAVLIVQSKYRAQGKLESDKEFESFRSILERLREPVRNHANAKVLSAAQEIDWEADTFELHYVTLGKLSPTIERLTEDPPRLPSDVRGLENRVEVQFFDESDLNESLRQALSFSDVVTDIEIHFERSSDDSPWIEYESDGHRSFIGRVSAGELFRLYQHKGKRDGLFQLNIRNPIGQTITNRDIKDTALKDPEKFFFFNNGVAAVATGFKSDRAHSVLRCERFSVINGAQTIKSLVDAIRTKDPRYAGQAKAATVMVRVTEISLRQNKEQEAFIENITKWNNTQNPVKVPDFRSNDLVQRDLHKRFAEISLGSRPLDYRNKRGAKDPKSVVPISMEEFAKTIHSFKWGPPDMWGGTAALFSLGKDGRYAHVFGDGVEPHNAYSDSEFRRVAGIWLVCTRVQEVWRQERETRMAAAEPVQETAQDQSRRLDMRPIVKAALERRWMVYAVVGVLLRERYRGQEDKLDEALERFSKPSHWIETDTAGRKAVDRLTKKACILLIQSYKSASQSPKFVQRNWNRSKDTIESIVEEVRTTFDPEDLPFLGAGK